MQPELFDTTDFNICRPNGKLANLRNSMRNGWYPFSVDKVQQASTLYGVSCEIVWKTYEQVVHEKDEDLNDE